MAEKTKDPRKVVTGKVRLSFPYLFEPRPGTQPGQPPKYSLMILIDKDDDETVAKIRKVEKALETEVIKSKYRGKKPAKFQSSILHDADEDGTAEEYPEREGCYYMSISSPEKYPPGVVDRNGQDVLSERDVWSGIYGRVSMRAFDYDTNGNKGISFGLNNVQVFGYGDRLVGGASAQEDFDDDFEDEDDDDSLV